MFGRKIGKMARRKRSEFLLELKRQLIHLFLGTGISLSVYLSYPFVGRLVLVPLGIALIFLIILPKTVEDLRLFDHLVFHFEREKDIMNFPFRGAILYGIGIVPPILFLPLNPACAIIVVLSAGDAMSTIVGKFLGKRRRGHKSLEGFLSFLVFSFLGAAVFVSPLLAFAFALLGAVMEFFCFIDDNLLIPVGLSVFYILLSNIIRLNPM